MTRFKDIPPPTARAFLAILGLCSLLGLLSLGGPRAPYEEGQGEDFELYQRIVERMRDGEGYYQATGEELRTRGYAVRPSWNWRLPTLAFILSFQSSTHQSLCIFGALAFFSVFLWGQILHRFCSRRRMIFGLILFILAYLPLLREYPIYFHETWGGMLLSISMAALIQKRWTLSVLFTLLALCVRELAVPYAMILLAGACFQRRRKEALLLGAAMLLYAGLLIAHTTQVNALLRPDDIAKDWWGLPGWSHVLETARFSAFLLITPRWLDALLLPLILIGLWGWPHEGGIYLGSVVTAYLCVFSVLGNPDNAYWGAMYTSLLPIGLLYAPASVWELARACR